MFQGQGLGLTLTLSGVHSPPIRAANEATAWNVGQRRGRELLKDAWKMLLFGPTQIKTVLSSTAD